MGICYCYDPVMPYEPVALLGLSTVTSTLVPSVKRSSVQNVVLVISNVELDCSLKICMKELVKHNPCQSSFSPCIPNSC
jgi:hypothetical protein